MFIRSDIQKTIRLSQEESLENDINRHHGEKIRRMVREIESYFIDMDYEEMVRSNADEKEDLRAAEIERQMALAHGIVVTKTTSPHLYRLVEQSLENLGIREVKNLTIIIQRFAETGGEEFFNAFCATTRTGSVFISFTPMLLNLLNDHEVMDVIGHELAHAVVPLPHYLEDYFYFVWGGWAEGIRSLDPDIPEDDFLQMNEDIQDIIDVHFDIETDAKIVRLIRLKELTADRFGLVASRNYRDSCASLMKQQTLGIDERFFDYDPIHLIRQLDELAKIHKDPTMRWIFDATHPVLPARIASLDVFYHSSVYRDIAGEPPTGRPEENPAPQERAETFTQEVMDERISMILQKSELLPEDEDLFELKLIACLFHQIVRALSIPAKSRSKIVRRMVWEKYRDLYASIPLEVFDYEPRNFKKSVSNYGKILSKTDDKHKRAFVRGVIGYLKEKKLLRHETKNYIMQTGLSLGLKRSVIINYLKRVGAWGRYIRKR
jgi:hypothetical protein